MPLALVLLIFKNELAKAIILLQSVVSPASQQAEKINHLFHSFNIAAACMLLLVSFLVVYICIKFRSKKNESADLVVTKGNSKLEAVMIGVPALLLAYFFYQTITVERSVAPGVDKSMKPDVIITGHQWWWEVEYPASKVITANEVHLPIGKHLLMEMRSADVIHDWWVPELGNKMDLIPNINNYLWLDINKPGTYIGACSEFCGAQHAWMRINVIAQTQSDFNKWLNANQQDAAAPADTLAIAGEKLFQEKTCANCHRIQGTAAIAVVGPDLSHIGSRQNLLTGLLKNDEDNLYKWINHPQKIKPGAHMPDFILEKDSVMALAHYLNELK
jgi:cytochrome c oxidase subunit 2